jgi:putative Holliday junction resolvase
MPDTRDARPGSSTTSALGFDFGTRVIGVAVGNPLTGARALATVTNGNEPDWRRIDALVGEWRPAHLIVGLPLTLDGGEQAIAKSARAFAATLGERYKLPVRLVDERLTSVEASRRFAGQRASGTARRKDAAALDAIAASIILESWFERGGPTHDHEG